MHRWTRRSMGARAKTPRQNVYESGNGERQARFPWLVCSLSLCLYFRILAFLKLFQLIYLWLIDIYIITYFGHLKFAIVSTGKSLAMARERISMYLACSCAIYFTFSKYKYARACDRVYMCVCMCARACGVYVDHACPRYNFLDGLP